MPSGVKRDQVGLVHIVFDNRRERRRSVVGAARRYLWPPRQQQWCGGSKRSRGGEKWDLPAPPTSLHRPPPAEERAGRGRRCGEERRSRRGSQTRAGAALTVADQKTPGLTFKEGLATFFSIESWIPIPLSFETY